VTVIEAYIAELDRALRGPRRAKADLLAEGRDSLVDAADSPEDGGLDRQAAEQRAVEEFGEVREVTLAPGTYIVYCSAGAHRQAGMEFEVTVG
jgi:plastocyanin